MRWTPGGRSDDIEDDRDQSGGGGGGFNLGGMHIGIGGFLILLVLSLVFKRNFLALAGLGGVSRPTQVSQPDTARDQREEPLVQFVSFVLDDTQKTWMHSEQPGCALPACEAGAVPGPNRFRLRPGAIR